jgi:7-carboxy-7-deazaguanine synthase
MDSLRITEIFYSLQGEANTAGIPTVFIRLTGCPLRCTYCDTAYAFHGGHKMTLQAILDDVHHYSCRYVTVTGGEPLAQANCPLLLDRLIAENFIVSLETSGALDISKVDSRVIKVMDLKTPSSGEESKHNFANIDHLQAHDQVKFVIGDATDYEWSKALIRHHALHERCDILFSPVMNQQNPTELAEKILQDRLPVRFQIQLHKLLWGDAQGK